MAEHCPLKRCAVPEDVARVVAFLASDDGNWVNGKLVASSTMPSRRHIDIVCRPSDHDLRRLIPVECRPKQQDEGGRCFLESNENSLMIYEDLAGRQLIEGRVLMATM